MDLENIMLSKINQSETGKNHIISLISGYKTETHRHRQSYDGYQRVKESRGLVKGKRGQIYDDRR